MTALPRGETPGSPAAADDDVVAPSPAVPAPSTGDEEHAPAGDAVEADGGSEAAEDGGGDEATTDAAGDAVEADGESEATEAGDGAEATTDAGDDAAPALSEAEAELAAQREFRERIEKRKAEKKGPISAGAKLSGTAAEQRAPGRAVVIGEKPAAPIHSPPAPAPAPPPP
ncbi:DNA helicase RecD, partial [Streptomyces sp. NPDC059604]